MNQAEWHTQSPRDCLQLLETSPSGLGADEVQARLVTFGENRIEDTSQAAWYTLFFNQFRDFMVIVLLAATLISGLLGEFIDAITIIAIIIVNALLGFFQELRAEKSLASLKQLTAPVAHVIRNTERVTVPAAQLVPGDIVLLESGDRIPADVRLLALQGFETEESSLTGESLPISKHADIIPDPLAPLGDRKNMGYMGTSVTRGKAQAVVVATGMNTEMGKIANLIQTAEDTETPLQRRLDQLGKILVYISLGITAVVVLAGILHGQHVFHMFMAGVSLAVAAIPEGLPAIVTIALAIGVQRMIKRKAIVRKLPSVETLGCATVICSDKTGTLTQNKMTVQEIWAGGKTYHVTGQGYRPEGEFIFNGSGVRPEKRPELARLLQISALCNNAELVFDENIKDWHCHGDPTEGALLAVAAKAGYSLADIAQQLQRVEEIPFDSNRKMMTVIVRDASGRHTLLTKGAPDVLLERCTHILLDGKSVPLTKALRQQILEVNHALGSEALRNIGVAYREIRSLDSIKRMADPEVQLTFVGLLGMIDPPRAEVFEAIHLCKNAGIRTVMITGDHQVTAEAIARQLGIMTAGGLTVTGAELNNMTDKQLAKKAESICVFARVSPEHKLRIVKALQENGQVVAMTGDGVNDAPAIQAADIGISMGQGGTDVAKDASALILSDDNFATIVAAIEEGRGIYDNIRKFVRYLLSSNVGEIITMFVATLFGFPLPLLPIQILCVNLVTDGLPAIALGVDPAEKDIMQRKPRNVKESIFARGVGTKIITRGIFIGICTLSVFWLTWHNDPSQLQKAQTMAFATLVMCQLIQVFDCRSVEGGIFSRNIFGNVWLIAAVCSSITFLLCAIYVPALQIIFKSVPLHLFDWAVVLVAAAIPTFALTVRRAGRRVTRARLAR
ncbi:calcium-translocating P-type ATPase, SERCA-type [Fodinisporobacter ferrooxydans]|uniref:Calcium-translocating P-type ATPase, SERCA-type n=1 Tax=Fodinisporobacter ferrooxydans TaxID=2901836 RepID=A0ABY4CIE0_9BACL|nr:calcium-translocating P-type ATPase, SERCA-type [Alicyclobacillaceae bacterium MYW30-H2]